MMQVVMFAVNLVLSFSICSLNKIIKLILVVCCRKQVQITVQVKVFQVLQLAHSRTTLQNQCFFILVVTLVKNMLLGSLYLYITHKGSYFLKFPILRKS